MSIKSLSPSAAWNKLSDAYHKVAEVHPELLYYAKLATLIGAGVGAGAAAVKFFACLQQRTVTRTEVTFPDGTHLTQVVAQETLSHWGFGHTQREGRPSRDRSVTPRK